MVALSSDMAPKRGALEEWEERGRRGLLRGGRDWEGEEEGDGGVGW